MLKRSVGRVYNTEALEQLIGSNALLQIFIDLCAFKRDEGSMQLYWKKQN